MSRMSQQSSSPPPFLSWPRRRSAHRRAPCFEGSVRFCLFCFCRPGVAGETVVVRLISGEWWMYVDSSYQGPEGFYPATAEDEVFVSKLF